MRENPTIAFSESDVNPQHENGMVKFFENPNIQQLLVSNEKRHEQAGDITNELDPFVRVVKNELLSQSDQGKQEPGEHEFISTALLLLDILQNKEIDTEGRSRSKTGIRKLAQFNQELIDTVLAFKQDKESCEMLWEILESIYTSFPGMRSTAFEARKTGILTEIVVKQTIESFNDLNTTVAFSSPEDDVREQTDVYIHTKDNKTFPIQIKMGRISKSKNSSREKEPLVSVVLKELPDKKWIDVSYIRGSDDVFDPDTGVATEEFKDAFYQQLQKYQKGDTNTFLEQPPGEKEEAYRGNSAKSMLKDMLKQGIKI